MKSWMFWFFTRLQSSEVLVPQVNKLWILPRLRESRLSRLSEFFRRYCISCFRKLLWTTLLFLLSKKIYIRDETSSSVLREEKYSSCHKSLAVIYIYAKMTEVTAFHVVIGFNRPCFIFLLFLLCRLYKQILHWMTCISGRNMDTECTQRCTSKKHADKIFAAISKDKEYEDKVLSFMNSCHNVATNRDSIGRTALHIAAAHGRMKIISWLLSKEASVNAKDSESGYSALHRAVYFGQLQAARYLLNNQANLFQTDHDSWSSMDHMIQDRASNTTSCTSNQLSEIYVWGSNDNYSLGML